MEVQTARLEIRLRRRRGKQEYANERENEESQIRGEERKRGSETDRHTMLWLSSAGNKGNVSLNTTHGSTHGSLDLGWELCWIEAFWHIRLVHLTPSERKRQISERHNSSIKTETKCTVISLWANTDRFNSDNVFARYWWWSAPWVKAATWELQPFLNLHICAS